MSEEKVKRQRLAKNPELIFKAASGLSLVSKVALRDQLNDEIDKEVEALKSAADYAVKIANGKQ